MARFGVFARSRGDCPIVELIEKAARESHRKLDQKTFQKPYGRLA